MEARFFCKTGALAGADYRIAGSATIGRGSSNTIVVGDGVVSKAHARIAFEPAAAVWVLEDLGSTNGTRLDGMPVSGRERLRDLHVVTLGGRHDFIFVVLPAGAVEGVSADSPPLEAGTRHDRPAALSAPPLAAGPTPGSGDSAGDSPPPPGDSGAVDGGTRHDRPAALSAPPLVAESSPGSGDSAASGDSGAVDVGTRHDRPAALSMPPLAAGPSPGSGDSAVSGDSGAVDVGTRHDRPAALSAPPLVAGSGPASADAGPPPSAEGVAAPAAGVAETPAAGVSFEVRPADGAPRRVTLGDGRHVFGRAKDCAVSIDDRTLSRRHAAFVVAGGRVSVEDLGSLNGTFVGGARIQEATEVGDGRVVGLGEQVTVLVGAEP